MCVLPLRAGGCTPALWNWSEAPAWEGPRLVGTLHDSAGSPPGAIVAQYRAPDEQSRQPLPAIIPLRADGTPVEPFHFTGAARQPDIIPWQVSEPQRRRIAGTRSDQPATARAARERLRAAHVVPSDGGAAGSLSARAQWHPRARGFTMIAYWPAGTAADPDPGGQFPQQSNVLLVPESIERPPLERAARTATGVAATPFTLAADAFIVVVLMVENL